MRHEGGHLGQREDEDQVEEQLERGDLDLVLVGPLERLRGAVSVTRSLCRRDRLGRHPARSVAAVRGSRRVLLAYETGLVRPGG